MDQAPNVTAATPSDGTPSVPPTPSGAKAARRAAAREAFITGKTESASTPTHDVTPDEAKSHLASETPAEPEAEAKADDVEEKKPAEPEVKKDEKPSIDEVLAAKQKEREERRAKDVLAQREKEHKEELERLRSEYEPKAQQFEKLKSLPVRERLAAAAEALGITREEFGLHARVLFSLSPEGQKDPKTKEAAEREVRLRERDQALEETRREVQELKQQLSQREQQVEIQRNVNAYIDSVVKAATAETPVVQRWLEKNPAAARTRLHEVAADLAQRLGEAPDATDVVRYLEKIRRQELEELGIDPDAALTAKKTTTPADETKTAPKTLSSDLATPTKPRSIARATREERRLETIRALERGRTE